MNGSTKAIERSGASCVLIGSESLAIQCAEILLEKGLDLRAVVSTEPRITAWASAHGLPTFAPGKDLAERLRPIEHDYFFSITNLAMIGEEVLALPRKAAINFHDGPLPRYAGMYTPAWALIHGEAEYGVTFHEMTLGADEGDLYVQRHFAIAPDDTSLTLNTRCFEAAIDAFGELVDRIRDGRLEKRPQDLRERSYFGRHTRPPTAAILDWSRPADELVRIVRALNFGSYENAFASARLFHAQRLHLIRSAREIDAEAAGGFGAAPGQILALDESGLTIACGDSTAIALEELTCPKGLPVAPLELAGRLSLSVGDCLELVTPSLALRIAAQAERATQAEAWWVNRLSRIEGPELPLRKADAARAALGPDLRGAAPANGIEIAAPARFVGHVEPWIAGFAAYLARICGRASLDLSYADPGLTETVGELAGLFADRVPLRIELDLAGTSDEAVGAVTRSLARVHDRFSFFQDVVARYPQLARNPLLLAGGLSTVAVEVREDPASAVLPFGADAMLAIAPGAARARFLWDPRALDAASATALVDALRVFLAGFAEPGRRLRTIALLAEPTRSRVLREWNDTARDVPRERCIHELFEEAVARHPEDLAVVYEGESLRYRELAARADLLADRLVAHGIGPDQLVGIYLDRSIKMVVAVLAVLKAGGAYVPLDPNYPADRIAYMIEDSRARVVVSTRRRQGDLPPCRAEVVLVDELAEASASLSGPPRATAVVAPHHLAYVIYTSGSTGKPKGVMVEHRNVVNFFSGMDERIAHDRGSAWLAVTSLSFDISVLELLWTLTRGFKLVVSDSAKTGVPIAAGKANAGPWRPIDFGLALWGSDSGPGPRKYELMLEAAKFGDRHGFRSVHTPERHFGAFGGPFPNPSVTSAAIAAVTSRIEIRASSCVLPLHNPIRVAEEWAVVDNLSGGRVGISFASGWQPNDFVIRPEAFARAKSDMFENARIVQRLWRGEAVEFTNPKGVRVATTTLPRPVQAELPSWMTTAGNLETFRAAGAGGFNVLTHLLGQTLEELAEKVKAYRQARREAGFDPAKGVVTCMLHTFVGEDLDAVRETVRQPMKDYLASAMALVVGFAWSFPAFARPGGPDSKPEDVDLAGLSEDETDAILEFAFERYFETSGLFGTPEICADMIDRCKAADIDEIASLIDFGLSNELALGALPLLDEVRRAANERPASAVESLREVSDAAQESADYSLPAQVVAHGISHLQCTPSHARMLLTDPDTRGVLSRIDHWMIGGEAFPASLAAELEAAGVRQVTNMYGPTETTIWSTTGEVAGHPASISIGRPIANTRLYILGNGDEPLPVGVPGELLIGGEGVVRGYHERPDLTAERFIPDPFTPGARLYRTGDLARWQPDGTIDFLGRLDHQVKIRGYRIELGEIETRLATIAGIREAVVIAREDTPGDLRLVAYLIGTSGPVADAALRASLGESLPEFMVPSVFVFLDHYPQTPNGKIDRKALPAPSELRSATSETFEAPDGELEHTIVGVWKEVLYLEQVGVDDNFFDLGGHSLLVVQAHRKLRDLCPKPLSLTDLYRFPTIRGLAGHLLSDGSGDEQVERSEARGERRREAMNRRRRGRGK